MQLLIYRFWPVLFLMLITSKGMTQHKDSILLVSKGQMVSHDSIFLVTSGLYKTADSLYIKKGSLNIVDGNVYLSISDSTPKRRLYKVAHERDSSFRKKEMMNIPSKAEHIRRDSVHQKTAPLHRDLRLYKSHQDSLFRKQQNLHLKTKSLQFRQDSLRRFQKSNQSKMQLKKLDSLKSVNWRKDSTRIKVHLEKLKSNLQLMKQDSARQNSNMQKKIISREVNCKMNGTVVIENMARKIIIENTDKEKVRIETTILVAPGFEDKDLDWGKALNISLEQKSNEVVLKRMDLAPGTITANGVSIHHSNAGTVQQGTFKDPPLYKVNHKSALTIYVPAGVKLVIESRYNDVTIKNDVIAVELSLMNSNLKMQDANRAVIKSRYGSVKAGTIKDADINLLNCNFTAVDLEKLMISSKYSKVNFQSSGTADIKSVSDEYVISNANYLTVTKSFGKLDITQLENSIVLTGSSADMSIKAIDASAKLIRVDNKYADIKLPVQQLPNYSLQFEGNNSNVFTTFERANKLTGDSTQKRSPAFSNSAGDLKKDFTSLVVSCASCSVDFR